MLLSNRNLELVSICRQSLIDASYTCLCKNCGKLIINIATVIDLNTNEKFEIGLDCKKTLIDNELLSKISNKYDLKIAKQNINIVSKFLNLSSNPNNKVKIEDGQIYIDDNKPNQYFNDIIGNCVFTESVNYLIHVGISKQFIEHLMKI